MSRTDARSHRLRRRPSRIVPATIVSLVVLALGVGLVWITVLHLLNGSWPSFLSSFNSWATTLTWGSPTAIAISLATIGVGLILLVAAWTPGRPKSMTLHVDPSASDSSDPSGQIGSTEYVMSRHAVAKLAAAQADQVDGVDSVSAVVTGRRVDLSVRSASEQRGELQDVITDRVRTALQGAGLQPMPTVTTTVNTRQL